MPQRQQSVASYFISFKSKEKKVLFFIFILSFFDLKKLKKLWCPLISEKVNFVHRKLSAIKSCPLIVVR